SPQGGRSAASSTSAPTVYRKRCLSPSQRRRSVADNATLPLTGTGGVTLLVATDDVGGVQFQRVKVVWGADGVGNDTSAANPLPVVQTGALPAGTNAIGTLAPGTNTIGYVSAQPKTTGGLSVARVVSAASTNATVVKASAGQVYGWFLSNTNAAARYCKIYNKATAPTVGTDVPILTLLIPAGGAANTEFSNGIAFATGIGLALTTGATDADTGAVAANECIANILFF